MSDIHDYLEDQLRSLATDIRRAAKRADDMHEAINPVTDFGQNLRLDVFSINQALEAALQQIEDTRQRVRSNRKKR